MATRADGCLSQRTKPPPNEPFTQTGSKNKQSVEERTGRWRELGRRETVMKAIPANIFTKTKTKMED